MDKLHEAMQALSTVCDGAMSLDGQGFNGRDTAFGKSLAAQPEWSPKQAAIAWKMLQTYRVQLGRMDIDISDVTQPDANAPRKPVEKPVEKVERKAVVLERNIVGFIFPYDAALLPLLRGWASWQKPLVMKAWQVVVGDSDKAKKVLDFAKNNNFVVSDEVKDVLDTAANGPSLTIANTDEYFPAFRYAVQALNGQAHDFAQLAISVSVLRQSGPQTGRIIADRCQVILDRLAT